MRCALVYLLSFRKFPLIYLFTEKYGIHTARIYFFTLFLGIMLTAVDWIGRNTDAALAQYRQMAVIVAADRGAVLVSPDTGYGVSGGLCPNGGSRVPADLYSGTCSGVFSDPLLQRNPGNLEREMVFLSGVSAASACALRNFKDGVRITVKADAARCGNESGHILFQKRRI